MVRWKLCVTRYELTYHRAVNGVASLMSGGSTKSSSCSSASSLALLRKFCRRKPFRLYKILDL